MLARCRVSFIDTDSATHTAHVQAESLYEAVALAVAEFRDDPMVSQTRHDDRVHDRHREACGRASHQAQSGREMGAEHDEGRTGGDYEAG